MSNWKKIPIENVEVDGDEVNILIDTDELGNNYICIDYAKLSQLIAPPKKGKV